MAKTKTRQRESTAEARATKRAAERRKMEAALEALRSSEGWTRWMEVRRRFHHYSFRNQILIADQCPEATVVAGFRRWFDLGYAVRKGETAIRIWAPCPPSKKALKRWREKGANPAEKPETFFRMACVFDRSQVDPLDDFPGGPAPLDPPALQSVDGDGLSHLLAPLTELASSIGYGVCVEEIAGAARGYCYPKKQRIVVEEVSASYSANAQIATAIHEVAHALLRAERREDDPALTRGEEEVVVECVAYIVCASAGLDTSGASVPYMASWSRGEEIGSYAALIDRLAKRIEEVVVEVPAKTPGCTRSA